MVDDYPDFEGGKQAVLSWSDWAAKEGLAQTEYVEGALTPPSPLWAGASGSHIVGTGKIFYVTGVIIYGYATTASERDLNQPVLGILSIGSTYYVRAVVNFSRFIPLNPPVKASAGETVTYTVYDAGYHNITCGIVVIGFEVDA